MKKPKRKNIVKRIVDKRPHLRRKKDVTEKYQEAVESLPQITNDTVAEHREEILKGARKYIYPLQHSKHHIVLISTSLFVVIVVLFFAYCTSALYKFQTNSAFLYDVTKVIPFPVAKAGSSFVSYESYLFELRHYVHYYQTQEQVDFTSLSGKQQLNRYKNQAMQQVINDAYVQQLAKKYHVSVSSTEVNNEITLVQQEDRLGSNQKELESVLSEFWGWTLNDFKQELSRELLAQKVASRLDIQAHLQAQAALTALKKGQSFEKVAAKYSDDTATKKNGGQFGFTITSTTQNLPPQTLQTLMSLKPGQISGIVNLGNALEIDKVISKKDGKIQAEHIQINFNNISTYTQPLKDQSPTKVFIKLPQ